MANEQPTTPNRQQMIDAIYASESNYSAAMELDPAHWTMRELELLETESLELIWGAVTS
jgi:hypothetical protein